MLGAPVQAACAGPCIALLQGRWRAQQLDLWRLQQQASRCITTSHTHVPKSQHDPYRTPPKNYVQLLQHITRARRLPALERLVAEYGPKFDAVHVAAAFSVLPRLHQPPAPGARMTAAKQREQRRAPAKLLAQLQALAEAQVPRMFAREVASVTWALGRCRGLLPGASGHAPATRGLVSAMLERVGAGNARMLYQGATGAEVAKLLHGLARLKLGAPLAPRTRQLCRLVAAQPQRLHARELAGAAWALSKMPSLAGDGAVASALDAISGQAVASRLYLRPASMCSLATACARLGRRDGPLLAAISEEALEQATDFRPRHVAVLLWALGRLGYDPGQQVLAALVASARRQLEGFGAQELGLLLSGLAKLGALDEGLLADVARGVAAEREVALRPRDAVRLLAAFVAAPRAGAARDVDRMARLVGDALGPQLPSASGSQVANLLVCYSKLPCLHPVCPALLHEAAERPGDLTVANWVSLLEAAARLGYSDPAVRDARVVAAYAAADGELRRHLLGAALPGAGAAEQPQRRRQQQQRQRQRRPPDAGGAAEPASAAEGAAEEPPPRHPLQFGAAADLADLLGARGALSEQSATLMADVGRKLLPQLRLRQLMRLLSAVSSGDRMAAIDEVRALLADAAARLAGEDLSAQSPAVLAGLAPPVARAVSRNMLLGQGEGLLRAIYAALLPGLPRCDDRQLLAAWDAMRRSGVDDAALRAAAEALAAERGLTLPREQGWGW